MDSIAYIGTRSALESPMGLILPLALIAATLLLLTTWKYTTHGFSAKAFLRGALYGLAVAWVFIWGAAAADYTDRSHEAAEAATYTLGMVYGVEIEPEAALAIVQDDLDGLQFKGQTADTTLVLSAEWIDGSLHMNSMGYEAAVLPQAGTDR